MQKTEAQTSVFHAIADPNRRSMLDLLRANARPVQEIAGFFDISLAAVSQHLKVLLDAGLVSRETQGRFRIYRANPAPLRDVHDWTSQYRNFWEESLNELGDYLDANADREPDQQKTQAQLAGTQRERDT